jgi:hypothetical protein
VTLLAAYSFDEASGQALDYSGNGRNVTLTAPLTRVTGHTGTGLGVSSGTVADSVGPALTGMQTAAYTIEGWVKRTSNSLDGWLLEYKQGGSGDRGLLFLSGNVQSRCKNVAGSVFTAVVAQPTAGTAYHFACTNDGTTLKLYINATLVASTAFSGGVRTNSTSSSFMDGVGTETWLDDARYYDVALTQAEIATDMATPVTASGASMTLGQAAGSGAAQAMTAAKDLALGSAGGSGTAQALSASKAVALGFPTGAGAPQAMSFSKGWALGAATGSGAPAATGLDKTALLGQAAGAGAAQALTPGKALGLQTATGSGTAQAVTFTPDIVPGSIPLGTAVGTGAPQAMAFSKAAQLGAATGVGAAQVLSNGKGLQLGSSAGVGSPRSLAAAKFLAFGRAQGAGEPLAMAFTGPLPEYSPPEHWTATGRAETATAGTRAGSTSVGRTADYTATTRRTPYVASSRES